MTQEHSARWITEKHARTIDRNRLMYGIESCPTAGGSDGFHRRRRNPGTPTATAGRAHYKCPDCPTEFIATLEVGDRKMRRWCKNCKHFIYPDQVTSIKTTQREVRVTKPKPLW